MDWIVPQSMLDPSSEIEKLKAENKLLRKLLALRAGGVGIYLDDGELSDATTLPHIDFKRDSAAEIETKLMERGKRRLAEYQEGEVTIDYTNWQGNRSKRRILPHNLTWGKNAYHGPNALWLLESTDLEKGQPRSFALKDIHAWNGPVEVLLLGWAKG